jgi:hypothetical protein
MRQEASVEMSVAHACVNMDSGVTLSITTCVLMFFPQLSMSTI